MLLDTYKQDQKGFQAHSSCQGLEVRRTADRFAPAHLSGPCESRQLLKKEALLQTKPFVELRQQTSLWTALCTSCLSSTQLQYFHRGCGVLTELASSRASKKRLDKGDSNARMTAHLERQASK